MIKKLTIKNIQSHKYSELEFSTGINCIVGSSNNGKSAVLRAMNWSIYNRPLGIDNLLSSWAYNDKGKQVDEMFVKVEKENSTLIRRKTCDENCYIVNDEKLEAIRTDVPEQVNRFFNLSDTNIQKQMDSSFLLSLSSTEVAKYFNKTVRLDVIDGVLGNTESNRRKIKSKIEEVENNINQYEKDIEKYNWLEQVEKLIKKIENLESKKTGLKNIVEDIEEQVTEYELINDKCKQFNSIVCNKPVIFEIESYLNKYNSLKNEFNSLNDNMELYKYLTGKNINRDFSNVKNIINEIEQVDELITDRKNVINNIGKSLADCSYYENNILSNKEKIKELKNSLPETCPLCGGILNNGECEND